MIYFGFENIYIKYEKKQVLEDVTLEFEKGTITTIIGKNGCGKSSLLKTLVNAIPYKGKIIYNDQEIKKIKKKELAKIISYLPQKHDFPSDIDVRTLVSYGRYPYKRFGSTLSKYDNEIIDEALNYAGLKELESQRIETLSGGEMQRAWIAMSIAQEPEILILDEPTTYLDLCYQIEVLELIKKLNKKGITIIMVLHDLNMAARYSDKLYAIKDKKVYLEGTPHEVLSEETLLNLYNIDAKVLMDDMNDCPYFIVKKVKEEENEIKE